MNFCQWDTGLDDGTYNFEYSEEYNDCCGEPAMWKRWGSYFCAAHYDKLCEMYGEPEPDEDL